MKTNRDLISFARAVLVQAATEIGIKYINCYTQAHGAKLWGAGGVGFEALKRKVEEALAPLGFKVYYGSPEGAYSLWSVYVLPEHIRPPVFNEARTPPPRFKLRDVKKVPPGEYKCTVKSVRSYAPGRAIITLEILGDR